jgi:hypothetical protein
MKHHQELAIFEWKDHVLRYMEKGHSTVQATWAQKRSSLKSWLGEKRIHAASSCSCSAGASWDVKTYVREACTAVVSSAYTAVASAFTGNVAAAVAAAAGKAEQKQPRKSVSVRATSPGKKASVSKQGKKASASKQWTCGACTTSNHTMLKQCRMCHTQRCSAEGTITHEEQGDSKRQKR